MVIVSPDLISFEPVSQAALALVVPVALFQGRREKRPFFNDPPGSGCREELPRPISTTMFVCLRAGGHPPLGFARKSKFGGRPPGGP